jgi:pseudomonalisin
LDPLETVSSIANGNKPRHRASPFSCHRETVAQPAATPHPPPKASHSRGVNGLCSTPYSVCVGGTEFSDGSKSSLYWSPSNASATLSSALSYIPEVVWNESGSGGLWASGGGASTLYAKPSWQTGTGVPADGKRDVPDVSLTAAGHDGYLMYQNGGLYVVGGTSAAAPSFAGLMALVVQHSAARQGNANTTFYSLASKQRAGGAAVFHDITSGNNSVSGEAGFAATVGYDQATGLGSIDASVLVSHWSDAASTPSIHVAASSTSLPVTAGLSNSVILTATVSGGFDAAVVFFRDRTAHRNLWNIHTRHSGRPRLRQQHSHHHREQNR